MRIRRHFTVEGHSPYEGIAFRAAASEIRNPDGSIVFAQDGIEVPESWSQVACDVLAQKYFRKAGVPKELKPVAGRRRAGISLAQAGARAPETTGEHSAKQVFDRLAGTWTYWGWKGGYFDGEADARAFYDELCHMLATQKCAPNSPAMVQHRPALGLWHRWPGPGPLLCRPQDRAADQIRLRLTSIRSRMPASSRASRTIWSMKAASWILWTREARLFKYGSGTGTNFSTLRGANEKLSGGGKSSGLMSFLKIGDRAAGAIKSGGTTRRAAKMVIVDIDHPDIEDFIDWKVIEEQKVASLVAGSKLAAKHLKAVMKACVNCEGSGGDCFDPQKNPALRREIRAARKAMIPDNYIERVVSFARQGYKEIEFPSLRHRLGFGRLHLGVGPEFQQHRARDGRIPATPCWKMTTGISPIAAATRIAKTVPARELWDKISYAAWACADPGIQFHTIHQRLAHLPGGRRNPRLQSVQRIHVPGRHRLQSGVAQSDAVPQGRRRRQELRRCGVRACASGSGPSCWKFR